VIDLGNEGLDSVDYPDYAAQVSDKISKNEADAGVLVCGTGIGMCITANKFRNVRAAVLFDEYSAKMAKAHNNANVICLGGRTTDPEVAWRLITTWLETDYEGGRHDRRLAKIKEIESQWG
jgi:ribose 5-phosphate isomerase B